MLLAFIVAPLCVFAQTSNTGFVPGNIWYSKDPFYEGDKIKIYTLVFNSEAKVLSGTVSFFDKNVLLGKKDFSIPANGVRDVSIDWSVTAGSHVIFGKIENAKYTASGKTEVAYLERTTTEQSRRTVSKKPTEEDSEESLVPNTDAKIQSLILENTPGFISKPVVAGVRKLEEWRENNPAANSALGPFFKNRYVFYGLVFLVFFVTVRIILRKIFS